MAFLSGRARRAAARLGFLAAATLGLGAPGAAVAALSVAPLTWDIIGLDSNSPAAGPRNFPVGARICSNAATAPLTAQLVWDSANANINLRPGSLGTLSLPALAANACTDAYFEVEVAAVPAAYGTVRRYHVAVSDGSVAASSPQPRQLYVERLVSQNRNYITNVRYGPNPANLVSVPNGGGMNLVVGNTYAIELTGGTATQGYEQFEAFINFTNTIFQVLSVSTNYAADTAPSVPNPNSKLYADACVWGSDPNSPNYRACTSDGKAGGSPVTTLYTVKIVGGGGTSQTLNTLLYDFSGSSFHYNADYSVGARTANVIDPTVATIAKSFSPATVPVNGVSVLTFTLGNPNAGALDGYAFVDNLPAGMVIATPSNLSVNGCGTPTVVAGSGTSVVNFSNGTVAGNGSCTIKVDVTPSVTGSLVNTTQHLFIGATDTGKTATATLTVNTDPPPGTGLCGLPRAGWRFETGFNLTGPLPTPALTPVAAVAKAGAGLTPNSQTTLTADGTAAWGSNGAIAVGTPLNTANNDYFEFAVDTSGTSSLYLAFNAQRRSNNGPQGMAVTWSTSATPAAGDAQLYNQATALPTQNATVAFGGGNSIGVTSGLNPSGYTYFRIYFYNAGNSNPGADPVLDDVVFTGCGAATKPTLAKAFSPSPIAPGATSTLTFTLTNPNAAPLTGARFSDTLPAGLQVAATPVAASTCGGSWAPLAGATTLDFGNPTGGTIPANGTCTVSVAVTAAAPGVYNNVSGFLSTAESGTTTTSVATATLTVLGPAVISERFAPNPILANGVTTLTFTLTNPDPVNAIGGVAFSDALPGSPGAMQVAAVPNASTSGCGSPTFAPVAGATALSFSGGSLPPGGSCTAKVDVTAPVAGSYPNPTSAISHLVNGVPVTGNSATDTLVVTPPHPGVALLKQVGPTANGPWSSFRATNLPGSVYYRFTVENTGDVPLSPFSVTDPASSVNLGTCTWPSSLPVPSPLNDNHIATCVVGPITAASGVVPNTADVSGNGGGTPVSDTSSAVYASTGLTVQKSAAPGTYTAVGDVITYTYLVTNSGAATLDGPITVQDDVIGTVACPDLTTVGDFDAFFDPGEQLTCTVNYSITAQDVTATRVVNTAYATNGSTNSPTDSATVFLTGTQNTDLSIVKTGPSHVNSGAPVSYTIVISNAGPGIADGATYSDLVPAAITGVGAVCAGSTGGASCDAPSVSGNSVTGTITTFPVGGSVTLTVTGTAPPDVQNLSNTATVAVPPGMTDTNPNNDSSTAVTATPVSLQSFEVE